MDTSQNMHNQNEAVLTHYKESNASLCTYPSLSIIKIMEAKYLFMFIIHVVLGVKLLGVNFDSNLSFENHVISLCKNTSQKLHALARISHYIDLKKTQELNDCCHCLSVYLLPPYMNV